MHLLNQKKGKKWLSKYTTVEEFQVTSWGLFLVMVTRVDRGLLRGLVEKPLEHRRARGRSRGNAVGTTGNG